MLGRWAGCGSIQQFLRLQQGSRPSTFREKLLAFGLQQQITRARVGEHATTSFTLDQLLVDRFLITLQNREWSDPIFGRDIAHRRPRIAFLEHAIEYHGDDTIAYLTVNRLTVVPLTIHDVFQKALTREVRASERIDHCASSF